MYSVDTLHKKPGEITQWTWLLQAWRICWNYRFSQTVPLYSAL